MQQSIVQSRTCRVAMIWLEQMSPGNGESHFAEREKKSKTNCLVLHLSCACYVYMFNFLATLLPEKKYCNGN